VVAVTATLANNTAGQGKLPEGNGATPVRGGPTMPTVRPKDVVVTPPPPAAVDVVTPPPPPPGPVDIVTPPGAAVVPPGDVVVVGRLVAQVGLVKWSLINVTEPFRASARPWTVTLFCMVIVVRARMLPTKVELLPRFAELRTCQ
jgi:hypothetical protein